MKDVFVSYARATRPFAVDLVAELPRHKVSCWIDQSEIGPGEQWRSALREGILEANNFVVLLDRAWLGSPVCCDEYRLATEYGKALVPVVTENVSPSGWKALGLVVPEELASRNYVWTHGRVFVDVVREVVAAIRTDYEWKQLLARLEGRAQGWRASDGAIGLLRGQELVGVQESVARAAGKQPAMTKTVATFIQASQREEMRELEAQRDRARRAESRALGVTSERLRTQDPIESLDLAGRAWALAPTIDALRALGQWYETHPQMVGMWSMRFPVSAVALDEARERFASCERLDAMVAQAKPAQHLVVQDLSDLGKIDELSDIEGFGGCAWADDKLFTLRRSNLVSYRHDVFRERFRQATSGVLLPTVTARMVVSPSRSRIAVPAGTGGLVVYDVSANHSLSFPTDGNCADAAWVDESTLLLVEDGGLNRRSVERWAEFEQVVPSNMGIVSVDAQFDDWVALAALDRVSLYRPGRGGPMVLPVHDAPEPAVGVRLGPNGTAFIYGGGGNASSLGLCEVDENTGQSIREWLGGFQYEHTVTAFDPGQGGWLAAGRRDGRVLLWSREGSTLDSGEGVPAPPQQTATAEVVQLGTRSPVLNVRLSDGQEVSAGVGPSRGLFVPPGPVPCAVRDGELCVGYGADLLWYELGDGTPFPNATGSGHTNPIGHLACSTSNPLWVSTAMNYRNNAQMELFAWDRRSTVPVMKLMLPWFNCTGLAFDISGQVLLLMEGEMVVKRLLMDPDRWIERGRQMGTMDWSGVTSRAVH